MFVFIIFCMQNVHKGIGRHGKMKVKKGQPAPPIAKFSSQNVLPFDAFPDASQLLGLTWTCRIACCLISVAC